MKREDAKAIISALVSLREIATDEMALEVPALYPKWREGKDYKAGERVVHGDVLYKVLQDHASQEAWTPDAAPSLFATVLTSDDGTPLEWVQPDSTNPYMTGDKVLHNGFVWESLVDNNVWEPTAENATLWVVVEGE